MVRRTREVIKDFIEWLPTSYAEPKAVYTLEMLREKVLEYEEIRRQETMAFLEKHCEMCGKLRCSKFGLVSSCSKHDCCGGHY